jgi:CheY-like chemotaxis protein
MAYHNQTIDRLCVIGEADPFLAQLLQRFAEKSGLRIQHASTGPDVLELAKRGSAVVILDPELPGKVRGWEAAQMLRAGRQTNSTPIIFCSWLKKNDTVALAGQASAYLQKPDLSYADFIEALNAAGVKIPLHPDHSH